MRWFNLDHLLRAKNCEPETKQDSQKEEDFMQNAIIFCEDGQVKQLLVP